MQIESHKDEIISFNQLYEEFQKRFVRFANTYLRDLTAAEDITIEAIMVYWENRHSLSKDSNVPAYILTIIKNKCLNYLRHQQIQDEYSDKIKDYYEWELNTRIATLQACEPYELFISEIQKLVEQTLAEMPERTRTIFMLNRYENKSYKEIALLMNITPKGVDFHISKALKMLQTNLKDYFPFFLYFFMKYH
ncbi:RNA polymerase sigma-70 factor [Bacteroides heparinolyticus]|uniref:RNA polymerase ECF-type sigma factor n=6 Tax=Prevotella heparinolytica TaxID=28113 RepID=A0A449I0A5_9BACE|nr:RNA polymerase sigma-70 factor [Bacteroides heparinolyticus]MCF0255146.1 RNA polymerase sigma-70 factor [Bacteroides heparinolyticus]MCI6214075.1 RNA polymerase sigma-70 factor [Bacteroides heparinolyticus]VFB12900.1 RNA polymerase ECF-type sigma factor [Bacteroides heparinolyticus]